MSKHSELDGGEGGASPAPAADQSHSNLDPLANRRLRPLAIALTLGAVPQAGSSPQRWQREAQAILSVMDERQLVLLRTRVLRVPWERRPFSRLGNELGISGTRVREIELTLRDRLELCRRSSLAPGLSMKASLIDVDPGAILEFARIDAREATGPTPIPAIVELLLLWFAGRYRLSEACILTFDDANRLARRGAKAQQLLTSARSPSEVAVLVESLLR